MEEPHVLVDMMGSEEEVEKFVQELERRVWEGVRAREEDGSFYMVMEQVGNIPNRGTFCAGRVLSGRLEIGDQVEAFYQGKTAKAKVKDLEIYKEGAKDIRAGDRAGAFVSVKPYVEMKRGGLLY